jgi:hypothetical protein
MFEYTKEVDKVKNTWEPTEKASIEDYAKVYGKKALENES